MFVDTFLRAEISGLHLDALAATYVNWVLGQGDQGKVRSDRLRKGVVREWTVERVLAGEALIGNHGCRVDMRLDAQKMLLRFVHRDTEHGAVLWHSSARVVLRDDRLLVEHAVGRDSPRDYTLNPVAAPPRIITSLIEKNGIQIRPRQLALPLVRLDKGEVQGFVEHELLNPQRNLPVVLISCGPMDGPPVVDPQSLSKMLKGLAVVAFLTSAKSTFEFSDLLAKHGLGPELRCYNGAVHTYGPTDDIRADHRLWLAESMLAIPDADRLNRVAGILAHRLASRSLPAGFFHQIDEYDREERRRLAEHLSSRAADRPSSVTSLIPSAELAAIEQEREALRSALADSLRREKEYLEAWNKADDDLRSSEVKRESAEAQLEQERLIASELRETVQRAKQGNSSGFTPQEMQAIRSVIAEKYEPSDILTLVSLLYRERVVVLETAFDSASKAAKFRHGKKLLSLLCRLASEYYDLLVQGKGDGEAGKIFGDAFAATESEVTKKNGKAIAQRTFSYNGSPIVMWPHLKIGVKESVAETIRVHFEWIAGEKKVVIGWCGEHRYRV